jgi:hypothetical protein
MPYAGLPKGAVVEETTFTGLPEGAKVIPPEEEPHSGFLGGDIPMMEITEKEAGQNIETLVRTGVEGIGMGLGALLGSFGGPAGTYAGGTAGYVGGKRVGNILYGTPQDTLQQDVAEGGLFAAIGPVVEGLAPAGRSMVGRALKIPPKQANIKVRGKAVRSLVAEDLGLSERGLDKAIKQIDQLDNQVSAAINTATIDGATADVKVLMDRLDALKPKFSNRANPKEYYNIIDQVKAEIATHPSTIIVGDEIKIPLNKAHELKKGLYQEIDSYYANIASSEPKKLAASQTESVAKAATANALREEVIKQIPKEAGEALAREAGLMNAKKWINRAVARAGNHDIITFNDVLLGTLVDAGIPKTVGIRILRSPRVQARIGILLTQVAPAGKAIQYGAVATENLLTP